MASWRPATHEPDALQAALTDYLRNRSAQVFLDAVSGARALGRITTLMSDGRELVIDLTIAPERAAAIGGRSALIFLVSGHAANNDGGWQVRGQVILDRKTFAFLSLEIATTVLAGARVRN